MTVTLSLATKPNRPDSHRTWSLHGTSVTVGSQQTAEWLYWLFRWNGSDWALIDSSFAGPVFGHIFDVSADNGVAFRLVYQVLEEGAGSVTEGMVEWTHSPTQPTYTKYVANGGVDDTAGGRGDSSGSPYATLGYAMTQIRALMGTGETGRVLARAGETHTVSASLWSYQETGRIMLDRYDSGANPILDLTADVTVFNGMGQHSSTGNCMLDWRNFTVTGGAGYTSSLVEIVAYGGASSMLDQSHVLVNIASSQTGSLVNAAAFPALSETEMSNGAWDCVAIKGCSLTSPGSGVYGIYGGFRYFTLDSVTIDGLSTARSGLRGYNIQFLYGRDFSCYNGDGDAFRILSTTLTADLQTRWCVFDGWASWDVPYLFHNTDNEGGDTTINKFWDLWFRNCRSNPRTSGGVAFSQDGDRKRISFRNNWLRGSNISFGTNNADNDEADSIFIENNTCYVPSFSGGDSLFVGCGTMTASDVISNWRIRNNFIYVASGSGQADYCLFDTAAGNITRSTIFASTGDSDYNVFLCPTGTIRWYRGVAGGNLELTGSPSWDDTGCDTHSSVLTAGTHGLTALGTADNDDYDFHISTSSVARNAGVLVPGGLIDYDNEVRVSTHDAGSHDADATTGPTQPVFGFLKFSTTLKNAWLDAIESTIGAAPTIEIRTGAAPANCAAADSGTLLVSLTLPSNWLADAASASKAIAGGPWTGTASAAGTAGHWRLKASGTCHVQGSCTAVGGGGDMVLNNTSIGNGQDFEVTAFTVTPGE